MVRVAVSLIVGAGVVLLVEIGVLVTDAVGKFVGDSAPFCVLSIRNDGVRTSG
jgi:hypothetical protein